MLKYLDKSYNVPSYLEKITGGNLRGIRWKSARYKNFLTVIKVLSERGECTASDLALYDGYSDRKKGRKNRQNIYSRIIEGDSKRGTIAGLLSIGIVQIAGTVMKSKLTKEYELSHLGIFYALHLFAERKGKRNFLDTIASNYKHLLPLIFGKWEFIKKEFGENLEILIELADGIDPQFRGIELDNPLMNVNPLTEGTNTFWDLNTITQPEMRPEQPSYFAREITLWFFTLQLDLLDTDKWKLRIMRDKEIHNWYYDYIIKLLKREREDQREVRYVKELITKRKLSRT